MPVELNLLWGGAVLPPGDTVDAGERGIVGRLPLLWLALAWGDAVDESEERLIEDFVTLATLSQLAVFVTGASSSGATMTMLTAGFLGTSSNSSDPADKPPELSAFEPDEKVWVTIGPITSRGVLLVREERADCRELAL
jgi:hypothetical protein